MAKKRVPDATARATPILNAYIVQMDAFEAWYRSMYAVAYNLEEKARLAGAFMEGASGRWVRARAPHDAKVVAKVRNKTEAKR